MQTHIFICTHTYTYAYKTSALIWLYESERDLAARRADGDYSQRFSSIYANTRGALGKKTPSLVRTRSSFSFERHERKWVVCVLIVIHLSYFLTRWSLSSSIRCRLSGNSWNERVCALIYIVNWVVHKLTTFPLRVTHFMCQPVFCIRFTGGYSKNDLRSVIKKIAEWKNGPWTFCGWLATICKALMVYKVAWYSKRCK